MKITPKKPLMEFIKKYNFHFLSEKEKTTLSTYNFFKLFADGKLTGDLFLDNLKKFKLQLMREDVSIDSIDAIEFCVKTNRDYREMSPQTWKNQWQMYATSLLSIQQKGIDGNYYRGFEWIFGKEIRVFRMPDVSENVGKIVVQGIFDMINEIGLKIRINYLANHPSAIEQVMEATEHNGMVDDEKLSNIQLAEKWRNQKYGGSPHADVVIINRPILMGNGNWWGSTFTGAGSTTISVFGKRQEALGFIRNVAKHETGHLLGFDEHHDDAKVDGYKEPQDCLMYHRSTTQYLCDRCKDALRSIWMEIEKKAGISFFK